MKLHHLISIIFSAVAMAAPNNLQRRNDECWFTGPGPVGTPNAVCAGSNGNKHTDVLWCPTEGVAERICGRDDVNPLVRDSCKRIVGTASYCTTGGTINKKYPGNSPCYCINGNFCCDQNAEVPGGAHPVDYYKSEGCNCGAEI
ncbi:hypothetical protein ACLX1H_007942 [Fusarium chlamydosporum]